MKWIGGFVLISVFTGFTFSLGTNLGHGVQILSPNNNHSFVLEINELNRLLDVEDIKDRFVVVVSIAGAFRQGKSFLLNFFLKYLEAQYKRHDISDWLGEKDENSTLGGFEWASGRKRKTIGIWMWSEIFTHDFETGEKVAIMLLDTQGIFDDQISVKECTTIFALSTMISSIQCYNIMQNIQEDHLQHLQLFTEYGRFALQHTNEKPFQKLLFIVRDWPYADDYGYGWNGQTVIDEVFNGNDGQTVKMRQLRSDIKSNFEEIGGYLMPHPGMTVARKKRYQGRLNEIDAEFKKYAIELVQDLVMPENLLIKKINGQKVRVRDLIPYLQEYVNVLNGDALPEPQMIYEATAKAHYLILMETCVSDYTEFMEKQLNENDSYFKEIDLNELHKKGMDDVIVKFNNTMKIGDESLVDAYRNKLENAISLNFPIFQSKNGKKRITFIENANLHNNITATKLVEAFERRFFNEFDKANASFIGLNSIEEALQQFDSHKMGDDDISGGAREKYEHDLSNFESMVNITYGFYKDCVENYNESMTRSLDKVEKYLKPNELKNLHEQMKNNSRSQFISKSVEIDQTLAQLFQQRCLQQLEEQFPYHMFENQEKHKQFIKRANEQNERVRIDIKHTVQNSVAEEINKRQAFDEDEFEEMLKTSIEAAIKEFDAMKVNDDDIASDTRGKLKKELENMQLKRLNTVHMYNIYLGNYNYWMQQALNNKSTYFEQNELQELHNKIKFNQLAQFEKVIFSDNHDVFSDNHILKFKLGNAMDSNLDSFIAKNNGKKDEYTKMIASYNSKIVDELIAHLTPIAFAKVDGKEVFSDANMNNLCSWLKETALSRFDQKRKGDSNIWFQQRQNLKIKLNQLEVKLEEHNQKKRFEYATDSLKTAGCWSLGGAVVGGIFGGVVGGPIGVIAGAASGAISTGAGSAAASLVKFIAS